MGLLDSVLGAVMNNQGGQQAANGGGLASIISIATNNPQLLQAVLGMLGNDGAQGGLGGLVGKFQQAGLGDAIGSWISTGQNQPVSGEQVSSALGADAISGMASQLGMNSGDVAGQLANLLPGLIDQLTPQGQAPAGGLGNSGDLMGMLGGLLQQRT